MVSRLAYSRSGVHFGPVGEIDGEIGPRNGLVSLLDAWWPEKLDGPALSGQLGTAPST